MAQSGQIAKTYRDLDALVRRSNGSDVFWQQQKAVTALNKATFDGVRAASQNANAQGTLKGSLRGLEAQYKTLNAQKKEWEAAGRHKELEGRLKIIEQRIEDINAELNKTPKATDKVKGGFDKVGQAIKAAFTATGILFLIDKVIEFGKELINVTGTSERYQNQFTRIFEGNAEAAKGYLSILQNTADTTNYTFDELANNVANLASRGILPTKDALLGLGDVANFINKDFTQLNEAILDGSNSERWKELGFTVKTQGDKMTLSYGSFVTTVENSAKGAYDAIQQFSKLEKVQGATAEAGLTLSGRVSTLADTFAGLFRTIGQSSKGALNGTIDLLTKVVQTGVSLYKTLEPAFDRVGQALSTVGKAIGGTLEAFGNLRTGVEKTATVSQTLGYFFTKFVINPFVGITLVVAGAIESFSLLVQYAEYAGAKLAGKDSLAATIGQQIDDSKTRLAELRREGQKLRAEQDKGFKQYVNDDNKRTRREQRNARLAEDAAVNFRPTDTGTKPAGLSDKDKKAREKALKDEYNVLQKAADDYYKEFVSLQEKYDKDRLDALNKDSATYLTEKARQDKAEIDLERAKLLTLLQLAASTDTQINPGSGKREAIPNTSVQLPTEIDAQFTQRKNAVDGRLRQDMLKVNADLLELQADSNQKELDLFNNKWDQILSIETAGSERYLALVEKRGRDEQALIASQALKQITDVADIERANIGRRKQGGDETATEFARRNALDLLAVAHKENAEQIRIYEQRSDDASKKELANLRAVGAEIDRQREKIEGGPKFNSVFELLGLADGLSDDQLQKLEQSAALIGDAIRTVTQIQIEESQKRIDAIQEEIDAKNEQIKEEQDRANEGYANNLSLRQQELADLKAQKAAEQQEQKKAVAAQQALDSISIASTNAVTVANLISAAAKEFEKNSAIPFVGVALAIAAIATIYATMATLSAKAKAITSTTKLRSGGLIENGRTHEQGGHRIEGTDIEVETGEFVNSRPTTKRYLGALEALNADNPRAAAMMLLRNLPTPHIALPEGYDAGKAHLQLQLNVDGLAQKIEEGNTLLRQLANKTDLYFTPDGQMVERRGSNITFKRRP